MLSNLNRRRGDHLYKKLRSTGFGGFGGIIPVDPDSLSPAFYLKGGSANLTYTGINTNWTDDYAGIVFTVYQTTGAPVIGSNFINTVNGVNVLDFYKFFAGIDVNLTLPSNSSPNMNAIYGGDFTVFILVGDLVASITTGFKDFVYGHLLQTSTSNRLLIIDQESTGIGISTIFQNGGSGINLQSSNVTHTQQYELTIITWNSATGDLNLYAKGNNYSANSGFVPMTFNPITKPSCGGYISTFGNFPNQYPIRGKLMEHCVIPSVLGLSDINGVAKFFSQKYNYTPIYY